MSEFQEKIVMITGASGNLGGAVSDYFYAEGAKLVLLDRHQELLHNRFPNLVGDPDCMMVANVDLMDGEAVKTAVSQIIDDYGRIDVLVHTVGGFSSGTAVFETERKTFDFMLNINAGTLFNINSAVLPHMVSQGAGKIINIGARTSHQGKKNMAAYSAAKAAVLRMTESISAEVKHQGVNVNCVLPGTIDTPENRESMPDANFSQWVKPASLADVIGFLCSEAARDIHGAAIPVYGLT